jgi:hypothetical protein
MTARRKRRGGFGGRKVDGLTEIRINKETSG